MKNTGLICKTWKVKTESGKVATVRAPNKLFARWNSRQAFGYGETIVSVAVVKEKTKEN